jgi:hypothetical protein
MPGIACEVGIAGREQPFLGAFDEKVALVPLPTQWSLSAAPNPFNSVTTIRYDAPIAGQMSIRVYDIRGHRIGGLLDAEQLSGHHSASPCESDTAGRRVAGEGIRIVRRVTLLGSRSVGRRDGACNSAAHSGSSREQWSKRCAVPRCHGKPSVNESACREPNPCWRQCCVEL